jgi:hypothetical protein
VFSVRGIIAIHVPAREGQTAFASGLKSRRSLVRIFIAGMLCLHLLFFVNLRKRIERGYPDFTVFYTAGTVLRDGLGHQLYDERVQYEVQKNFAGQISSRHGPLPYIHPPFEALIFWPLSRLPYHQAFVVWDALNGIALFGVAWVLRRSVSGLSSIPLWEFVIASLAFFPVFVCLLQGQDSILLLLLCALAFNALRKNADFLAGCWFALGMFKFQLIVPIVLLVFLWKRRRVAAGFATVSLLLVLVSAGLVGWKGLLHYPAFVLQVAQAPSLGAVPPELMANLRGLILGWPLPFSEVGTAVALVGSVVLFVFATIRGLGPTRPPDLKLQFSLAIVVSVLTSWHTNAHDLSLLVLPLVLIADYCLQMPAQESRRRVALLLPVLPVLISPLWIVLWLVSGKINLMAIPLLWWAWAICKQLSRDLESTDPLSVQPQN